MPKDRRGGKSLSNATKAIVVTFPNNVQLSYRDMGNGVISDLNMSESIDTNGLTLEQITANAKNAGATVRTYTKRELKKYDAEYAADRKATSEFLDRVYARNRDADLGHKAYRNTRKASRIAKR